MDKFLKLPGPVSWTHTGVLTDVLHDPEVAPHVLGEPGHQAEFWDQQDRLPLLTFDVLSDWKTRQKYETVISGLHSFRLSNFRISSTSYGPSDFNRKVLFLRRQCQGR